MLRLFNILLTSTLFISLSVFSQYGEKKTYFAIGLFAGAHSQMVTYAFVTYYGDELINAEIVSRDRFMYSAFGYWPSAANLKRENLFLEHGIDSCLLLENDFQKISGYSCPIFEEFWKIRFYEHPMEYDIPGWSQGQFKPSRFQSDFLRKKYGIKNVLTDYIYADALWDLLQDMQKPEWIIEYRFVGDIDSTYTGTDTTNVTTDSTSTGP